MTRLAAAVFVAASLGAVGFAVAAVMEYDRRLSAWLRSRRRV